MNEQKSDEYIDKKYSSIINYFSSILCKDIAVLIGEYFYHCKGNHRIIDKINRSIDTIVLINLVNKESPGIEDEILLGQSDNNELSEWWGLNEKNINYHKHGIIQNLLTYNQSKLFFVVDNTRQAFPACALARGIYVRARGLSKLTYLL